MLNVDVVGPIHVTHQAVQTTNARYSVWLHRLVQTFSVLLTFRKPLLNVHVFMKAS